MRKLTRFFITCILLLLLLNISFGYKMEPPDKYVHQWITNESSMLWSEMPNEMEGRFYQDLDYNDINSPYWGNISWM